MWNLILTIVGRHAVAITSVPFNSEDACRKAAEAWKNTHDDDSDSYFYSAVCVPAGDRVTPHE